MNNQIKHIDGLSGQEEYLALQEINKNNCPNCHKELTQISEDDTNAVLGVYCENCNHQEKY